MNTYTIKTTADQFSVEGDDISINETTFILYVHTSDVVVALVNMSQLISVVVSPLAN